MKKSMLALLTVTVLIIAAIPFVLKWTSDSAETAPSISSTSPPTRPMATNGEETLFVRTNGSIEGEYPKTTVIRSVEELTAYYEANKYSYDLENDAFLHTCEEFDTSYFSQRILVLAVLQEGSGSIRHKVTQVRMTTENILEIDLEAIHPAKQTADMAQWHVFVQPASGVRAEDIADIKINRTERHLPSRTGTGYAF